MQKNQKSLFIILFVLIIVLFTTLIFTNTLLKKAERKTDYFAATGSQGAVSDPTHPQGIYYKGKTYIVFQGKDFDPYIISYDHQNKLWSNLIKVGDNPLVNDAHGIPSLLIDKDGYLHVFYGSHGDSLKYSKSTNPEYVASWSDQPDVTPKATYPQPILLPEGTFYLFYRAGGHLDPWVYRTSSDNGRTWSEETTILQGNPDDWYLFAQKGENRTIHAVFYWTDDLFKLEKEPWRYNIYYMFRDENGYWKSKQGLILTLPLSKNDADSCCRVFDSEITNTHTNHAGLAVDNFDNPYIIFTSGKGIGLTSHVFKFAKWNGNSWAISDITGTDSWWDGATLDVMSSSKIEAYLTAGGTKGSGREGIFDDTDRGGNIEKWVSKNGGETWSKEKTIISKEQTGNIYNYPQLVENHHPSAKIIFSQWISSLSEFNAKVYLWGDRGFLKR